MLQAGKLTYEVQWWVPGMPIIAEARLLGADSETEYLRKGDPVKPVIAQVCDHDRRVVQIVSYVYWEHYFYELYLLNPDAIWVFHNAPFDIKVLGDPRVDIPWMLTLLSANRVKDTMIRFKLHQLRKGTFNGVANLAYVVDKLFKVKLDKREDIRFTFKQFNPDGTPWNVSWDHINYAALDAIWTCQAYEEMSGEFATEEVSLFGDIVLEDISDTGLLVDQEVRTRLLAEHTDKLDSLMSRLDYCQWRPGAGSQGQSQKRLEFLERLYDIKIPRTPGKKKIPAHTDEAGVYHEEEPAVLGQIQMTDEALKEVPDVCTFISLYKGYQSTKKVISTYLQDNALDAEGNIIYERIGTDGRVHPHFTGMVKTGRTSCSEPNIQNVPRSGGVRTIYKAQKGYVLFACDYSQAELCALAQHCYTTQGYSKMLEVINGGEDLHVWLGNKIFLREPGHTADDWENLPNKDGQDDQGAVIRGKKFYRQLAKALNFGKPGGLAAKTFLAYAKGYGVSLTLEEATSLLEFWVESFPEMEQHLQPAGDGSASKVNKSTGEKETFSVYRAETLTGRVRAKATYCSACNYPFQGLVADGAKWAMWYLWLEGFRMVNFIHDEVIFELKEDDPELHTKIARIKQLMLYGMRLVLPDVTGLKVEGSLMRSWRKEAEELIHPKYKETIIWEDAVNADWVTDGELVLPEEYKDVRAPAPCI
jgi:hypothetical protein